MEDKAVKFLSTTTGRDRVNRFVQYLCRFLIWHYTKQGASKDTIRSLTNLMATVGLTRKVLFTGRQLEFYQATVKECMAQKDYIIKVTTVLKNLSMILWLTLDTCQWLHATNLILFSFIGNLYKLRINARNLVINSDVPVMRLKKERSQLLRSTLQDSLDVILPVAMLDYIPVESGYLGLIGAATSLIGAYSHWKTL
ncbi:peroxisomal biogenesis factor 11-domain-containing protein [Chytriomyces cf. hyalinus JEL632]|nr:peroxisomal biogenesis factor 11-domain-containing protein [Chytriomyces cf. hyalinus JEL632]